MKIPTNGVGSMKKTPFHTPIQKKFVSESTPSPSTPPLIQIHQERSMTEHKPLRKRKPLKKSLQ